MSDRRTVTIVVGSLAAMAIFALGGVVWLVSQQAEISAIAVVSALAGQALGGLTGILSNTRTAEGGSIPQAPPPPPAPPPTPMPVVVTNIGEDPVPVEPVDPVNPTN